MNAHAHFEELLPLHAAGQLAGAQQAEIQQHLAECAECQADLELWMAVSTEIKTADLRLAAPPGLAGQALERIHTPNALAAALRRTWGLLRAQALLIQREIWPAAALVMAMGAAVALLSERVDIVYFLAPLVAASTLAILYGPEHDQALELTQATPTSPWKILLARMSIVSAYNLLLALVATLVLLAIVPPGLLGGIILGWLSPLAFLSALALLLSMWLGTNNAVAIAYALWMVQYAPIRALEQWMASPAWTSAQVVYQQFWRNPLLLLALTALLISMALWSANRPVFRASQPGC